MVGRNDPVAADGALSARVDHAQKASVSKLIDRQRNFARGLLRAAEDRSQISLVNRAVFHQLAELCVDVRVFCQKDHAEGVAVEPCDGVDAAGLVCSLIIAQQRVCQRPLVFAR